MSSSIVKSPNAPSTSLAYGSVLLAAALWGGSIVAQKMALGSFSAVEASVLRDIGGLAILLTTWWWQEGTLAKLTRRADGGLDQETLCAVRFVPLVGAE